MSRGDRSLRQFVPWGRLLTLGVLSTALAIAISKGQTIGAIIIGVLTVPTLVFLVVYAIAWKKDLLDDE